MAYEAPKTVPGKNAESTLRLLGLKPLGMFYESGDVLSVVVKSGYRAAQSNLTTLFGYEVQTDASNCVWEIEGCGRIYLSQHRKGAPCAVSFNKNL